MINLFIKFDIVKMFGLVVRIFWFLFLVCYCEVQLIIKGLCGVRKLIQILELIGVEFEIIFIIGRLFLIKLYKFYEFQYGDKDMYSKDFVIVRNFLFESDRIFNLNFI